MALDEDHANNRERIEALERERMERLQARGDLGLDLDLKMSCSPPEESRKEKEEPEPEAACRSEQQRGKDLRHGAAPGAIIRRNSSEGRMPTVGADAWPRNGRTAAQPGDRAKG